MNFWRNKKILVTGHTGFKGGWLCLWLKMMGAKVCGYSIDPITKESFFKTTKLSKVLDQDHRKNIENYHHLEKVIAKFKPEIIFHLAAQPQVLTSYNEPFSTIKTNFIGTVNLLEIIKNNNFIKSAVIVTTDKVYKNNEKNIKFKEGDALGGDDVYSASKACADIMTLSYIKSFFQNKICNIATVRAGNCIGGGDWTKYRILTDAVNAFSKNQKLIIRNPKSKRPWQHLLEPLSGYILLAKKLYKNKGSKFSGAWNFGPDESNHSSVYQFANSLKYKMQSKSKIIIKSTNQKLEKKQLSLNSRKAKKVLGWSPTLNENLSVKLTAEWYLAFFQKKNMLEYSKKQIIEFCKTSNFFKHDLQKL